MKFNSEISVILLNKLNPVEHYIPTREGAEIMEYVNEITKLNLTRDEFNNLIFMGPPPVWRKYKYDHEFLLEITFSSLKDVVEMVINESRGDKSSSVSVFKGLDHITSRDAYDYEKKHKWFSSYATLADNFDKSLMPPLWIRNKSIHGEEAEHDDKAFYLHDGNHRALVYAVRLHFGEEAKYDPVKALHALSWKFAEGLLGFECHTPDGLLHHGHLYPKIRDYVKGFHSPPVKIYERLQ